MDQLGSLLEWVQSADSNIRQPAENQLQQYEANAFPEYLRALTNEFVTEGKKENVRIAAALQIKRILTGQDDASTFAKKEKWNNLAPEIKSYVKGAAVHGLTLNVQVGRQAAQIVEAVARYELENGTWPELIDQLVAAFDQMHNTDKSRIIAPLLAIGYVCDQEAILGNELGEEKVNTLLGKIAIGMNASMSADVQVAATQALSDTLEFAHHNMESKSDRDAIMGLVFGMTEKNLPGAVQEKALQCLSNVLLLYYYLLPEYMEKIWSVTYEAIRGNDEQVAKQALNFWADMCSEELQRSSDVGLPTDQQSHGFVDKVQSLLCELVLNYCLLKQEEEPDDDETDENTLYGAAENFFYIFANFLNPSNLQNTLQYVQMHLVSNDWRHRQAALFALGTIISADTTSQAVRDQTRVMWENVLVLLDKSKERAASVRQTATWTLTAISVECIAKSGQEQLRGQVLKTFMDSLADHPRVANLSAAGIFSFAAVLEDEADSPTNFLSNGAFMQLASALWTCAQRPDADQWQLMENAYEALGKLIEVAALDMHAMIGNEILPRCLLSLQAISRGEVHDTTGYAEVELCGVVITCCLKLKEDLMKVRVAGSPEPAPGQPPVICDSIVETMINILKKPSLAHADALQCIGEVILIVGESFAERYAAPALEYVMNSLKARQSANVCVTATRTLSDIVTSIRAETVASQAQPWMDVLFRNLSASDIQKEVKPPLLGVVGDIASAIGPDQFKPFFRVSVQTAMQAFGSMVDITDEEFATYLNELRESALGCLELVFLDAFPNDIQEFLEGVFNIAVSVSLELVDPMNYYRHSPSHPLAKDIVYRVSPAIVKSVLGILGDLADKMKGAFTNPLRQNMNQISALFEYAKQSDDGDMQGTAQYAMQKINQ